MSDPDSVGDEHMGEWVYCSQHMRPHQTGWCTVHPRDKVALEAKDEKSAYLECTERGFKLYTP